MPLSRMPVVKDYNSKSCEIFLVIMNQVCFSSFSNPIVYSNWVHSSEVDISGTHLLEVKITLQKCISRYFRMKWVKQNHST